jgi:hypothetical protein
MHKRGRSERGSGFPTLGPAVSPPAAVCMLCGKLNRAAGWCGQWSRLPFRLELGPKGHRRSATRRRRARVRPHACAGEGYHDGTTILPPAAIGVRCRSRFIGVQARECGEVGKRERNRGTVGAGGVFPARPSPRTPPAAAVIERKERERERNGS